MNEVHKQYHYTQMYSNFKSATTTGTLVFERGRTDSSNKNLTTKNKKNKKKEKVTCTFQNPENPSPRKRRGGGG